MGTKYSRVVFSKELKILFDIVNLEGNKKNSEILVHF